MKEDQDVIGKPGRGRNSPLGPPPSPKEYKTMPCNCFTLIKPLQNQNINKPKTRTTNI